MEAVIKNRDPIEGSLDAIKKEINHFDNQISKKNDQATTTDENSRFLIDTLNEIVDMNKYDAVSAEARQARKKYVEINQQINQLKSSRAAAVKTRTKLKKSLNELDIKQYKPVLKYMQKKCLLDDSLRVVGSENLQQLEQGVKDLLSRV